MNRQEPYIGMPINLGNFDVETSRAKNMEPRVMQECSPSTDSRQPMALAMAYVPWQRWSNLYPLDEGFHRGTIFPELDLPFEGYKMGGGRR